MDQFEIRKTEKFAVLCFAASGDNKSVVPSASADGAAAPRVAEPTAEQVKAVEEENHRLIEEELKARAAKARGNKKASKSLIVFDVKPWEADTDLEALAKEVRKIEMEGLSWGEGSKFEDIGYGIKKLVLSAVVVDDLVQTELVIEKITELEDYVQSVDIAAFNKL